MLASPEHMNEMMDIQTKMSTIESVLFLGMIVEWFVEISLASCQQMPYC